MNARFNFALCYIVSLQLKIYLCQYHFWTLSKNSVRVNPLSHCLQVKGIILPVFALSSVLSTAFGIAYVNATRFNLGVLVKFNKEGCVVFLFTPKMYCTMVHTCRRKLIYQYLDVFPIAVISSGYEGKTIMKLWSWFILFRFVIGRTLERRINRFPLYRKPG